MKIIQRIVGLLLFTVIATGCLSNKIPEDFDYGQVEGNLYSNAFFDFELTLPEAWHVQSDEQTEQLMEIGQDMAAGKDENMKAILKAAEVNTAYLLTVFEHEVGANVMFNPSIMLIAENLNLFPSIKTGGDYLEQSRLLFMQSQIGYNYIDSEFEKVTFDDQEFFRMNVELNNYGVDVKQSYYTMIKNDFAVNVIISYADQEQLTDLQTILSSINFND